MYNVTYVENDDGGAKQGEARRDEQKGQEVAKQKVSLQRRVLCQE